LAGVAASVRGKSHEGQLCQDAHHWEKLPEGVLVAAVADGAGSATLGKWGDHCRSNSGGTILKLHTALSDDEVATALK